jgi:hypothetical protein
MTAGGVTGNVHLGPGRLYVATLATADPTSASAALPSAWRAVGYTEQGSAFSTVLTNSEVLVEEEVDPILYVLSKRANTLAVALAETTRQNLALSLGDMTGAFAVNDGAGLEPPDPGVEAACKIVWDSSDDATDGSNRRWLFRQAKPGGTINIPRRKAPNKATIAVTFSLEKPSSARAYKVFPNSSGAI